MKHTTYIFDFDGTLVDSMPSWIGKIYYALNACEAEYPEDIAKIAVTLGDGGTANYFRDELGVKLSVEEIIALMDEFALPKYRDEIVLKEGVREYLKLLKENGCSLNVLTASPHKMVDPCLRRNGVYDLFDNVWTCEDFGLTKSNVEIYYAAAQRLGVKTSDVVFVDDNLVPIKVSREAGMFALAVHDASAEDNRKEIIKAADKYAASMTELELI